MASLLLAGCGAKTDEPNEPSQSTVSDGPDDPSEPNGSTDGSYGSHKDALDEDGFFKGVKALEHVEMFNYHAFEIPNDVHFVADDVIQSEIDYIVSENPSSVQILDRAVVDGDTVNIDYTGTVDGVEFAGGSTDGMGADVTIGVTQYIDDFLEQLIGHKPGDIVDVEVTFPDDYGEESLQGKDALFVTAINYIVDTELTDDYVAESLYPYYGWTTVEEMKAGLRSDIQKYNIQQYLKQYFTTEVVVNSVPDQLMEFQESAMLSFYQEYAEYYGVEIEELLSQEGLSSVEELLESYYDTNLSNAVNVLVIIAIAEDAGFRISDDELAEYFFRYEGSDDYSMYVEQYGLPYVKHNVLCQKVMDYVIDNAVLA